MAECPKCKWINRDDARKCANCNGDLVPQQQPNQPQQTVQGGPQYPQQSYAPQDYSQPPQQQYQQPYGQQYQNPALSVPDNLAWSIVVTILCCWAFGIAAIVKACEANSKKAAGDYYGAMAAYEASRKWTYWSVGTSLVIGLIYIVVMILGAASGAFD